MGSQLLCQRALMAARLLSVFLHHKGSAGVPGTPGLHLRHALHLLNGAHQGDQFRAFLADLLGQEDVIPETEYCPFLQDLGHLAEDPGPVAVRVAGVHCAPQAVPAMEATAPLQTATLACWPVFAGFPVAI